MPKINNSEAGYFAARREEFDCNGALYGRWRNTVGGKVYVVYSYGEHHPLYVWEDTEGRWYENTNYASRTTSKHRRQARPCRYTTQVTGDIMKALTEFGRVGVVQRALAGHPVAA